MQTEDVVESLNVEEPSGVEGGPPLSTGRKFSPGFTVVLIAMVLATGYMVASIVAGVGLMHPGQVRAASIHTTEAELSSQSLRKAYGGDAYTGIQNAASDTENAVVRAANMLAASEREFIEQGVNAQSDALVAMVSPIQTSLGFLIIASGVGPFLVTGGLFGQALTRRRRSENVSSPAWIGGR